MFIADLFEDIGTMNTLVVYPGRFQPWHKGHRAVYDYLVKNFGRDRVFIATSNKIDPPRSPFSFSEKLQFMHLTGISNDIVVETRDPYKVPELVQKVNPVTTKLIFAVSQKDMDEDPRFKFGTKKDGTPTYFQPMPKNVQDMQSLDRHAYIMVVPTFEFKVLGEPMRSATEVRAQFGGADEKTQAAIIKDLFGSYSREVHDIMRQKLMSNNLNENILNRPTPTPQEIMRKHNIGPEEMIAQLKLGVKTELEHTKDARVAYEIALDHLDENPHYYDLLNKAGLEEDAAGVGVIAKNKKMARDPRYSMSITQDVRPGQDRRNMQALRLTK